MLMHKHVAQNTNAKQQLAEKKYTFTTNLNLFYIKIQITYLKEIIGKTFTESVKHFGQFGQELKS